MTKATMPKMIALIVVGMLCGFFLVSVLDGTPGIIFMLVSVLIILALFAYAIWLFIKLKKTAKKADPQVRKAALAFEPVDGKAVLYVYRPQFVGKLVGFDLLLDQKLVGQTHGGTFFRLELEPGQHELAGNKKCKQVFTLEAEAGDVLYVQQEIMMGAFSGGYQYRGVASAQEIKQAQSDIRGCKMYLPQQV